MEGREIQRKRKKLLSTTFGLFSSAVAMLLNTSFFSLHMVLHHRIILCDTRFFNGTLVILLIKILLLFTAEWESLAHLKQVILDKGRFHIIIQ